MLGGGGGGGGAVDKTLTRMKHIKIIVYVHKGSFLYLGMSKTSLGKLSKLQSSKFLFCT